MRRGLFILALALLLPGWAEAADGVPQVRSDGGSLVLGDAKDSHKATSSQDTLYNLLGGEVQVYIYRQQTRAWPQPMGRGFWVYRGSPGGHPDPRVELLINKYAGAYGVDPALVRAVMRNESDFNPMAVSPKGAQGLMQLMPGTAAVMGVQNPFDPEQNIAGGVGYLRNCLDRFGHNVPLAVAAYNAGPEAVAKYCAIPPYLETQLFVNNVMGTYGLGSPNQAPYNPAAAKGAAIPPGNVKPGPPGLKKGASETARTTQEKDPNAPHRPKAKIIEVHPRKVQTRAIAVLKD
jgi:transglycosylase-like protein with SLT domain